MTDLAKLDALGIEDLQRELDARHARRGRDAAAASAEGSSGTSAATHLPDPALDAFDDEAVDEALQRQWHARVGAGGRMDLYGRDTPQDILDASDGVLGIWYDHRVSDNRDGTSTLTLQGYASTYSLCTSEQFYSQFVGPANTAFLVAPDIVATAGSGIDRNNMFLRRFVFGFLMFNATEVHRVVPTSDVYRVKEMIDRKVDPQGADWALFRLDRPVPNHRPLRIRRNGVVNNQASLHIIGHPCGLPLKYAMQGLVSDNVPSTYFGNTLTTYGGEHTVYTGNRGSPVFDSATGLVEGIHCRGDVDFDQSGSCKVSHPYDEAHPRNNSATRTTEFAQYLANYAPFSLVAYCRLGGADGNWLYAKTLAPNGDIFVIWKLANESGYLPMFIIEAAQKYTTFTRCETTIKYEAGARWTFAVAGNRDLFAIKMQGCASGHTEVHVLTAESGYQTFATHRSTPLEMTDDTWAFGVPNNRDVFCIKRKNTGTGSTEVHILSAESDYTRFSYQNGTVLPETDASWDFAVMPNLDLYAIQRTGGTSNSTEITLLRFSDRYRTKVRTTGSFLAPVDATWSFASSPGNSLIAMQQPAARFQQLGAPASYVKICVIDMV